MEYDLRRCLQILMAASLLARVSFVVPITEKLVHYNSPVESSRTPAELMADPLEDGGS